MPQPYNYSLNLPNPIQNVMNAVTLGRNVAQLRTEQAQAGSAQNAQQYQADLAAVVENPNPREVVGLMLKYPQLSEQFKRSYDALSDEQRQTRIGQASQVYAALESDQPEIAQRLLQEQAVAARNSGQEEQAKAAEHIAELIKLKPEAARTTVGLSLASAMGPDKFNEAFTTLQTEQRKAARAPTELDKLAADLGLTQANKNKVLAETKKLNTEARKAALELEAMEKAGGIDPAKKFDQEDKLRNEYTKRTKSFREAQDAYQKIDASSKDGSGAGDIALVTSFMKMLDPGSAVRETEFATARDTAGLLTRLQNAAEKLQTGRFLDETQRKAFARLAKQYMAAAEKNEGVVKNSIQKVVKNYGLNPENVFTTAPGETTVTISGQTYEFPDAESAAAFRKEAGVQ